MKRKLVVAPFCVVLTLSFLTGCGVRTMIKDKLRNSVDDYIHPKNNYYVATEEKPTNNNIDAEPIQDSDVEKINNAIDDFDLSEFSLESYKDIEPQLDSIMADIESTDESCRKDIHIASFISKISSCKSLLSGIYSETQSVENILYSIESNIENMETLQNNPEQTLLYCDSILNTLDLKPFSGFTDGKGNLKSSVESMKNFVSHENYKTENTDDYDKNYEEITKAFESFENECSNRCEEFSKDYENICIKIDQYAASLQSYMNNF